MKARDLMKLGYEQGKPLGVALQLIPSAAKAMGRDVLLNDLKAILTEPNAYTEHPHLAFLAQAILEDRDKKVYVERPEPAPYKIWGQGLEAGAVEQMVNAARLPVAVRGALMPDAHQGYGLPIGGVLATENAVIPYAVGVDIACRMKLSVMDIPVSDMNRLDATLKRALERETVFGVGGEFRKPQEHEVLEADWSVTPLTRHLFDKARAQLGTSGSGNHFVECGIVTFDKAD
jgi:tRNA-splicing ligase RtcB